MEQVAVLPVPGVPVMRMFGPERSFASICFYSARAGAGHSHRTASQRGSVIHESVCQWYRSKYGMQPHSACTLGFCTLASATVQTADRPLSASASVGQSATAQQRQTHN